MVWSYPMPRLVSSDESTGTRLPGVRIDALTNGHAAWQFAGSGQAITSYHKVLDIMKGGRYSFVGWSLEDNESHENTGATSQCSRVKRRRRAPSPADAGSAYVRTSAGLHDAAKGPV